jgi:hypothetical protein
MHIDKSNRYTIKCQCITDNCKSKNNGDKLMVNAFIYVVTIIVMMMMMKKKNVDMVLVVISMVT